MTGDGKLGRPRKQRPKLGDPLAPGMSLRDIEAATGVSRRRLAESLLVADIPADEFEAMIEGDSVPSCAGLLNLARRRARKASEYTRRCPHCGKPLRIEDAR